MVRASGLLLILFTLIMPFASQVGARVLQTTAPTEPGADLIVSLLNFGAVGVAAYLFWRAWKEEREHSRKMECRMLEAYVKQAESYSRLSDAIERVLAVIKKE